MKRARDIRDHLSSELERLEIDKASSTDHVAIRKTILKGYFFNVAKLTEDGSSKTLKSKLIVKHHSKSSLVENSNVVFYKLNPITNGDGVQIMTCATIIFLEWLSEIAPKYYNTDEIYGSN